MRSQVTIVGAGPIGLLLGCLLGKSGIDTIIIDKKEHFDIYSKAIGIMPPSFDILRDAGVFENVCGDALQVENAVVHGSTRILGRVTFTKNGGYDYIISHPQCLTETELYEKLKEYPSVKVLFSTELTGFAVRDSEVVVDALDLIRNETIEIHSDLLAGCDGAKSNVRGFLGKEFAGARYKDTFLMGDFNDTTGLGHEAHLFFTKYGAVESFPLSPTTRRWIVQTPYFMKEHDADYLEKEVSRRTGITVTPADKLSESPFGVQHFMVNSYTDKRVFLCGDAAHVMSPIGGQGMNTGFADVEFAAKIIIRYCTSYDEKQLAYLMKRYTFYRRKAARAAIRRAALSMGIGTVKGSIASCVRNIFIYFALHSPFKRFIPYFFAMLTIKYRTVKNISSKDRSLLENNNFDKTEK